MTNLISSLRGSRSLAWNIPAAYANRITQSIALFGIDNFGLALQVLIGSWYVAGPPSKDVFRTLFADYRQRQVYPLVITLVDKDDRYWMYGPSEDSVITGPLPASQSIRILQACLDEPSGVAARNLLVRYLDSLATTAMPGVSNTGLFASHFLRTSAPERKDWNEMAQKAEGFLLLRGEKLVKALGFSTSWEGSSAILLRNENGATRAVAVLLEDQESFSAKSERFLQSPVAHGLQIAQAKEVPWLIVLKGSQIRLYSAKPNEGVGRKGQSETYFEVDLAVIDNQYKPLVPLIFSADALGPKGTTEEFLKESSRFAASLGKRLRNRVYDEVVPALSVAVANEIRNHGMALDLEGLSVAYGATLRILFRILFQAYGEDRSLLPYGRNATYDRHSLKAIAKELSNSDSPVFVLAQNNTASSDSYYQDMLNVWEVIDKGDSTWGVPAYNGGLFGDNDVEGSLLARISIPNHIFIPALRSLLVDSTDDNVSGPVDFRSLSVREFGTIYEGLLESSLSLAESDLTLARDGTWVPAIKGEEVIVKVGEAYFHSASGTRKATGSYFTPSLLVDHLLENSLVPALDNHLIEIEKLLEKDDQPKAARRFFDFRVADLAMGSGHFLVSAIDQMEARMAAFLNTHPLPEIEDELRRLEQAAHEALGELAQDVEISRSSLLRRQIARRCIYGIDINRIGVELARVAIWIHTFVPGLAMSSLDHGLVCGDSITGIGAVDEALSELDPPQSGKRYYGGSLFREVIDNVLREAGQVLSEVAATSEATAIDVKAAKEATRAAQLRANPIKALFDVAIAIRLGFATRADVSNLGDAIELSSRQKLADLIDKLRPAHMPFLFPEVFLRERAGFDVLVGNPPWEKIKVEEEGWWAVRSPGLRSIPQIDKNRIIQQMKDERPELLAEYLSDIERADFLRSVISKGPYPGIGSGDIDLYQAFAWRNYQLLAPNGYIGVVLPRGALAGSGTKKWREEILENARFASVTLLANSRKWVFEEVDPRYNVGLVCIRKAAENVVAFNGPFHSAEALANSGRELFEVSASDFKSWSSTAAFPWLPDEKAVEVFLTLRSHPRFDSEIEFSFRPTTELHTSANKSFYDFDLNSPSGDVQVLTGASFNLWNPDFGQPYAYAHSNEIIPFLEKKLSNQRNNRRSAFYGLNDDQLTPRPWARARVAFRDVTNATNTRTVVACLLPPGVLLVEKAPFLISRSPDSAKEAYLLGVMSTQIFDWFARRFVELKLSYELLNPMPIPRPRPNNPLRNRVITISGRLAAIDDRYATWAEQVGVEVGSVKSPSEKEDLITELDAVVAHLYGLSEDQLVHIFETFHIGWDFQNRLEKVLEHYRNWKKTKDRI